MAKKKISNEELKDVQGGAFYRYVMLDKIAYKCNSCNHEWESETKPSCCPNCGSTQIEKK